MRSTTVSVIKTGSLAGDGTLITSVNLPSGETKPAAIFVPPISIPIDCKLTPDSKALV